MKGIASKLFLLAAIAAPLVFHTTPVAQAAPAAIITVNSTADTNVYDSVMTLREAMLLATGDLAPIQLSQGECNQVSNSTYGPPWSTTDTIGAASADIIVFNSTTFPPASPATIALTSTLPILDTGGDTIDGSSRGVIVSGVSKAFVCFLIPSNNNTIKGLEIYNCDIGIVIQFGAGHNTIGGTTASERNVISGNEWGVEISGETYANTVWGNYIGTNAAGTSAIANSIGVYIHEWAQDNTIGGTTEGERNVISGNSVLGVQILGPDASDNVVKGNYIGTNAAGTAAIPNGHGVAIEGAQNTIIGGSSPGERNVISGNDGCGVGLYTSGNVVKGNYIGTNAAGTAAIPNGDGVRIWGGYNTIGGTTASARNVISGNGDGVDISGDLTEHNTVQGNYIGTNAAGTGAIANGTGVYIHDMAHDNTIGGSSAGERNVISGNGDGVQISGSSTGNIVKGNYIGTNASGTAAVHNFAGVSIQSGAYNNTVGGGSAGERNVISGNSAGLVITDDGTDGNIIKGNYIGIDASGTAPLPNSSPGVTIQISAQSNTIGGSSPGERNVISGNGGPGAVYIASSGNVIKGNYIGTNASGTTAIPNQSYGVYLLTPGNTIGGTTAGEGNLIAYSTEDGVYVDGVTATGDTIRGNSIHHNGGKGIENINGGNTELAPPIITVLAPVGGTACPNCTVDIYSDDEDEGRLYQGSTIASGVGNWSFSGELHGPNITATATDAAGNTSEFSAPAVVDSDRDGFIDTVEAYLGTDPLDACPDSTSDDAWPPDIKIDRVVNVLDVAKFRPYLFGVISCCNDGACYDSRYDLKIDKCIDVLDVVKLRPYLWTQCTNP